MDCKKHASSNTTFIKVNVSSMYKDMGLAPAMICRQLFETIVKYLKFPIIVLDYLNHFDSFVEKCSVFLLDFFVDFFKTVDCFDY